MLDINSFNQWASYHNSCYAGFLKWMMEDATDERQRVWRQRLEPYTTEELKLSSFAHFKLPSEHKGTGFTAHLEGLEKILQASRTAQREPANVTSYGRRCGLCGGTGMVSVVALPGFPAMTTGGYEIKPPKSFGAACKCDRGDKYRKGFKTFDATRMETERVYRAREFPPSPELQAIFELSTWGEQYKAYVEYRRKRTATMPSHSIGAIMAENEPLSPVVTAAKGA